MPNETKPLTWAEAEEIRHHDGIGLVTRSALALPRALETIRQQAARIATLESCLKGVDDLVVKELREERDTMSARIDELESDIRLRDSILRALGCELAAARRLVEAFDSDVLDWVVGAQQHMSVGKHIENLREIARLARDAREAQK